MMILKAKRVGNPHEILDVLWWDGRHVDQAVKFCAPMLRLPHMRDPDSGQVGGPGIGFVPTTGCLEVPGVPPQGPVDVRPGDYLVRYADGFVEPYKVYEYMRLFRHAYWWNRAAAKIANTFRRKES